MSRNVEKCWVLLNYVEVTAGAGGGPGKLLGRPAEDSHKGRWFSPLNPHVRSLHVIQLMGSQGRPDQGHCRPPDWGRVCLSSLWLIWFGLVLSVLPIGDCPDARVQCERCHWRCQVSDGHPGASCSWTVGEGVVGSCIIFGQWAEFSYVVSKFWGWLLPCNSFASRNWKAHLQGSIFSQKILFLSPIQNL